MSNKNLFKEAIADAKAVREAALANAKAALEEALTPKLQSMLAAKLNEMENYEEEELEEKKSEDEMEEGYVTNQFNWNDEDNSTTDQNKLDESEDLEEDFDLSEILAELNDESEELEEAKKEKEEAGEEAEGESEKEEATEEEPTEEEGEEEVEVKDMTIEDLKDLIKDIVSQEIETPATEMGAEEMGGEEMTAGEEDEIDLEELLAELDSLNESKEVNEIYSDTGAALTDADFLKAVGAVISAFTIGGAITWLKNFKAKAKASPEVIKLVAQELIKKGADKQKVDAIVNSTEVGKKEMEEAKLEEAIFSDLGNKLSAWAYDTNLDTIKACKDSTKGKGIAAFQDCLKSKGVKMASIGTEPGASAMGGNWKQFGKTTGEFKEELEEAIETINTLRTELNETNLLNAKLLYVNKIFKAKNLTESQKLKVIASFDKATNVKEAKVVFESLESALTAAPKKAIKESLGFASKAAGVAPNKTIVESNDVISRMQKLANIK